MTMSSVIWLRLSTTPSDASMPSTFCAQLGCDLRVIAPQSALKTHTHLRIKIHTPISFNTIRQSTNLRHNLRHLTVVGALHLLLHGATRLRAIVIASGVLAALHLLLPILPPVVAILRGPVHERGHSHGRWRLLLLLLLLLRFLRVLRFCYHSLR
ncbi:hypothetical protein M758_UG036300 [Ceratodon purpureus]|nr:hypothetical protein M758_UG036300 [Ceratodon purpureus]